MIRISSNKHNCKRSFSPLKINGEGINYDKDNNIITIKCVNKHCLLTNDNIVLKREDGRNISFSLVVPVENIINSYEFTIKGFNERLFTFDNYEIVKIHDINGEETSYYKCTIADNGSHIFLTNKDNVNVRGYYYWSENESGFTYEGKINLCKDEHVLVDDVLLYQVVDNGEIGDEIKNIRNAKIHIFKDFKNEYFSDCLIGVNLDGSDNIGVIYIPYEKYKNEEYFLKNSLVYSDDIRFFHGDGDNSMVFGEYLQPGTTINKINGDLEFDFNISEDFATNLFENEMFNNYCEEVKEKNINDIIDYERHQYTPMYYIGNNYDNISDDTIYNVAKISFDLHFRVREKNGENDKDAEILDVDGNRVIGYDYGSWTNFKEDVNDFWNTKNYLDFLGFTDDDVFYQKEALKRSFVRLLFYDSKNIATQQLLFYSTIYFDTNYFSKEYLKIKNIKKSDKKPYIEQVGICSNVYCCSKYNDEFSSDGFYLHLYDKMVLGNTTSKIYMKVEFNNAKNGVVVPFVWNNNGKYIIEEETGDPETKTVIYNDVEGLLNDMYKEIYLKYNFKTKKYNWILPYDKKDDNGEINFDLYEAVLLKNE